jgi:hypothetical protein
MMLPLWKYCVADACWAPISAATSPAPTSNGTPQQRGMRQRRKRIEPGSPTALRDGEIFLDSFNDQAARWRSMPSSSMSDAYIDPQSRILWNKFPGEQKHAFLENLREKAS